MRRHGFLDVGMKIGQTWAPELFPDLIAYSFLQESLAAGPAASCVLGGWRAQTAVQASGPLQPIKESGNFGVKFAANSGQYLSFPTEDDALLLIRWGIAIFKVNGSAGGSTADLCVINNHASPSAGDRSPTISINRANATASITMRCLDGGSPTVAPSTSIITLTSTADLVSDGVTYNVLTWHRRFGRLFLRLNQGAEQVHANKSIVWYSSQSATCDIGSKNIATNAEYWIDRLYLGQGELPESVVDKLHAWGMWRWGRQASLPVGSPYILKPPIVGADDAPDRYIHNVGAFNTWRTPIHAAKGAGTLPAYFGNKGLAPPSETAWEVVFGDDFRAKSIQWGAGGPSLNSIWHGPGWNNNVGGSDNGVTIRNPMIRPHEVSESDAYGVAAGQLNLAIRKNPGGKWCPPAIYTINDEGQGRTWRGPRIIKARIKFPNYGSLAATPDALFPAHWGYALVHMMLRHWERPELDHFEWEGDDPMFLNGGTSHVHRGQFPGILGHLAADDAPAPEYINRRLDTAFWGFDFNPYDGAFHTWASRLDTTNVVLYVDTFEIVRVPVLSPYHLQEFYFILDNALLIAKGDPGGTSHDMNVDFVQVLQPTADLAKIPTPFTALPTITGSTVNGSIVNLDPKLPASVTDFHVWWRTHPDGQPILGFNGNQCTVPNAPGQSVRAEVVATGYVNKPHCTSLPTAVIT